MNCFFLGAYWAPRQESTDACTDRLTRFFHDLSSCAPILSRWYQPGRSRKKSLDLQVDVTDRETLRRIIEQGRNWTDFNRRIIHELGFSLSFWNGAEPGQEAGLRISCGAYADHKPYPNNLVLNFSENLGELAASHRMRNVLAATAAAWQPDWAAVASDDAANDRRVSTKEPFVDWMLYLSQTLLPRIPQMPRGVTVSMDLGTLIVVQDEPPDPTNATHVEHIQSVSAALKSAWHLRTGQRV